MPLILICSKCGGEINITDEMLEEAKASGKPFSVVHDVCPKDVEVEESRRFKTVFQVFEIHETREFPDNPEDVEESMELIAQFGSEYKGVSFEASLPKLQAELQKGWEQVQSLAPMIDQPDMPTSTPETTPG